MYPRNRSTDRARLDPIPIAKGQSLDHGDQTLCEHPVLYDPAATNRATLSRIQQTLLADGGDDLSESELLAFVLGPARSVNLLDQAKALLRHFGDLHHLGRHASRRFTALEGLTPKKAARLAAVLELARRSETRRDGERVQVRNPADVAAIYGPRMRDFSQEVFRAVYLSTANFIIADPILSRGGLAASIVEPRAVFKRAMLEDAASVICLHNHPSSNPEPSREDLKITRQLVEAGDLMGIPLHDHIIIAGKTYTSFAERGLL